MAHVEIRPKSPDDDAYSLIVDGVELGEVVTRNSLRVEFNDFDAAEPILVHVSIAADTVDIDLPEAVIEAIREEPKDA